jgi:ferritin-like metal-binding protein YciE
MKLDSLRTLLIDQVRHLYHAENQLKKGLARMSRAASSEELRQVLDEHRNRAEQQSLRLEEVFSHLDTRVKDKKCEGMQGLLQEARDLIDAEPEASVLDAGLIAVAQRIEHYEIAAYGTARTWAQDLGVPHVAELLQTTLEEETAGDRKLTDLATHRVNRHAEVGFEQVKPEETAVTVGPPES